MPGVDTAWVRDPIREREGDTAIDNLAPGRLVRSEAVAEAYWQLYQQPPDAWTFEQGDSAVCRNVVRI